MASTLMENGQNYHLHTKFTLGEFNERNETKPSKLFLLQKDYRARLLREREQKANAVFEQRGDILPKQGSVRQFFFNRRMLATATAKQKRKTLCLPPIITSTTRYKDNHGDKTKLTEKQLLNRRKGQEKREAITFQQDMEKAHNNVSEIGKLREKYLETRTENQVFPAKVENNFYRPTFPSTCDPRRVKNKPRALKSREVYKRGTQQSHEVRKKTNTKNENDHVSTSQYNDEHASVFAHNDVSRSLVKIKELANQRKKEKVLSPSRKLSLERETMKPNKAKTKIISQKDSEKLQIKTQAIASAEEKVNEKHCLTSAVVDLAKCRDCGRSFVKERIKRHETACRKASSRVKKPFDARRKRAEGTDNEKYINLGKDATGTSA